MRFDTDQESRSRPEGAIEDPEASLANCARPEHYTVNDTAGSQLPFTSSCAGHRRHGHGDQWTLCAAREPSGCGGGGHRARSEFYGDAPSPHGG